MTPRPVPARGFVERRTPRDRHQMILPQARVAVLVGRCACRVDALPARPDRSCSSSPMADCLADVTATTSGSIAPAIGRLPAPMPSTALRRRTGSRSRSFPSVRHSPIGGSYRSGISQKRAHSIGFYPDPIGAGQRRLRRRNGLPSHSQIVTSPWASPLGDRGFVLRRLSNAFGIRNSARTRNGGFRAADPKSRRTYGTNGETLAPFSARASSASS